MPSQPDAYVQGWALSSDAFQVCGHVRWSQCLAMERHCECLQLTPPSPEGSRQQISKLWLQYKSHMAGARESRF